MSDRPLPLLTAAEAEAAGMATQLVTLLREERGTEAEFEALCDEVVGFPDLAMRVLGYLLALAAIYVPPEALSGLSVEAQAQALERGE